MAYMSSRDGATDPGLVPMVRRILGYRLGRADLITREDKLYIAKNKIHNDGRADKESMSCCSFVVVMQLIVCMMQYIHTYG